MMQFSSSQRSNQDSIGAARNRPESQYFSKYSLRDHGVVQDAEGIANRDGVGDGGAADCGGID